MTTIVPTTTVPTTITPVRRKLAGVMTVNLNQKEIIGATLPGESMDSAEPSPMKLCNAQ